MRKLILIVLVLLNINAYSQKDSTLIQFNYLENEDLRLMNELNGIQMFTLSCSDTLMKGKRFILSIREYNLGKLSKIDSLGLICEKKEIPVVVGTDTMIYEFNICDQITYKDISKEFKIKFAGKFQNDSLHLIIRYPNLGLNKKLKGGENYLFRETQAQVNGKTKISLNSEIPIFAYTGPFEGGSGFNSYCMLNNEPPEIWYDKFKVMHYYLFYLEIK
jgi:hypothetical protein